MARLTATAYAAHRQRRGLQGQSQPAVSKAIRDGRLTEPAVIWQDDRWQIDPELADEQWQGSTTSHQQYRSARSLQSPPSPPAPTEPAEPPEPGLPPPPRVRRPPSTGAGSITKAEADRVRAVVRAEREKLAFMKEKEEVGLISEMQKEAAKIATQVRDSMLLIADRLPPRLANLADIEEIRDILTEEIETALRTFS